MVFSGRMEHPAADRKEGPEQNRELRDVLLPNLQPDLQQGAFLAALISKGETPQEIGYQRAMVVHGFDASREKGMDELSIGHNRQD